MPTVFIKTKRNHHHAIVVSNRTQRISRSGETITESKEYLDNYDAIEEAWSTDEDKDAKQKRDNRARELRKQGWTVQIDTLENRLYYLFAERKKT